MRHPQRDDAHSPSAEDEYSDHLTRHPNKYSVNYIKAANEPVRSGGAHADGEPNEPFKRPDAMGFVAMLGVISLIGMVIHHSVMLIAQIDDHITAGEHPRSTVISATEHRLQPILLTAAAAVRGMIPIAPTMFWGSMAYAVMGGLVLATLLMLVFLPALNVAWFRINPEHLDEEVVSAETAALAPA